MQVSTHNSTSARSTEFSCLPPVPKVVAQTPSTLPKTIREPLQGLLSASTPKRYHVFPNWKLHISSLWPKTFPAHWHHKQMKLPGCRSSLCPLSPPCPHALSMVLESPLPSLLHQKALPHFQYPAPIKPVLCSRSEVSNCSISWISSVIYL